MRCVKQAGARWREQGTHVSGSARPRVRAAAASRPALQPRRPPARRLPPRSGTPSAPGCARGRICPPGARAPGPCPGPEQPAGGAAATPCAPACRPAAPPQRLKCGTARAPGSRRCCSSGRLQGKHKNVSQFRVAHPGAARKGLLCVTRAPNPAATLCSLCCCLRNRAACSSRSRPRDGCAPGAWTPAQAMRQRRRQALGKQAPATGRAYAAVCAELSARRAAVRFVCNEQPGSGVSLSNTRSKKREGGAPPSVWSRFRRRKSDASRSESSRGVASADTCARQTLRRSRGPAPRSGRGAAVAAGIAALAPASRESSPGGWAANARLGHAGTCRLPRGMRVLTTIRACTPPSAGVDRRPAARRAAVPYKEVATVSASSLLLAAPAHAASASSQDVAASVQSAIDTASGLATQV